MKLRNGRADSKFRPPLDLGRAAAPNIEKALTTFAGQFRRRLRWLRDSAGEREPAAGLVGIISIANGSDS